MKKLTHWIAAAVLIGSVLALAARAADSPSVLLQKGIYAEETEGNVDAAIKIYEQIGAEAATNRAVAAQALYRLAMCYQKKGSNPQAIALLKELLRQFPTETALGEQAQARLTELGQAPSDVVTIRKLPITLPGEVMAVSPDGRFFASWANSYDIVVSEPATSKRWTLVTGTSALHVWGGIFFSPDSRRIAYDISGKTIRISNSDGSEPTDVYSKKDDAKGQLSVLGWSADAARLFVIGGNVFGEIDLHVGGCKEIRTIPDGYCSVSADGRYVAVREGMREAPGKISLVDLATSLETTLVGSEAREIAGWSPWGERLFFTSDRTGAKGLWAIQVKDGKAAGEPELVSANIAQGLVRGIGSDGRIYYTERKGFSDVYAMSANFETGEITREPRRVTDRFLGVQVLPQWSADGRSLMFAVQRSPRRFVTVAMDSGALREFPVVAFTLWRSSWSQVGGFLVFHCFVAGTQPGIQRFELASGKVETLVGNGAGVGSNWQPELSTDGKSFYFIRRLPAKNPVAGRNDWTDQILRRDLQTAKEEIVYGTAEQFAVYSPLKLSPDGSQLAVVTIDSASTEQVVEAIRVINLSNGRSTEVVRLDPREDRPAIAWTADGKRIVYVAQGEIWSASVTTGEAVKFKSSMPNIRDIAIHPDGQQIAFTSGVAAGIQGGHERELWVMEGALTRQKTASVRVP